MILAVCQEIYNLEVKILKRRYWYEDLKSSYQ